MGPLFGRSPLPSEDLVVTSDGSFNPLDGSAGWGITLSVRGSEETNVPGQLIGCAYGPLDVLGQLFNSALLSLGAYAAETVGLLWAALMLFQLRWRRGTVFRCDSTSALHAMHGQVDGKPHSVCRAARSLHLALMCLLGSGMRYEHVAGHSGDCANELADALAARGAQGIGGSGLFGLDFPRWFCGDGLAFDWLPHLMRDQAHPGDGPHLANGIPCQGVRPIFEGIANAFCNGRCWTILAMFIRL